MMGQRWCRAFLPLLPIAFYAGFSGAALAQNTVSDKPADTLDEIVVTAQKRESTVQTTPISMTALSGKDLAERGITDFQDVVQSVPGISMRTMGPGQTEIEMRGMTSSGGNSSTVGFYLDDVPLTAPAAASNGKMVISPNLYDLNRIEVLRGPQGTLYGSGSMGGTIKLVPNAPDPKAFDTSGELIFGGTDGGNSPNRTVNAMVNLPLSDTAALRLVGSSEYQTGWIDRIVIANPEFPAAVDATTRGNVAAAPIAADYHDVNDVNLYSARASLLWQPSELWSIEPSFLYQKTTQNGPSLIDSPPGTNASYHPFDFAEPYDDRIDLSSLNTQFHFGFADLNSTTSFWTRDAITHQDGSEPLATAVGVSVYSSEGGLGQTNPSSEDNKSKQLSEEIRLTSAGDSAFKWMVGYFYQDFESDYNTTVITPDTAIPGTDPDGFTQVQATKILQNSFFGEASYTLFDKLTTTVGLRRYHYNGAVNTAVSGWLSSSGGPSNSYYNTGERDSGVTPKLNLSYQLDKDTLLYGTLAQGIRPGGGNLPIPTTGPLGDACLANLKELGFDSAPLGFKPDKVWSYEVGEKYRGNDGRLTVNSAAYFEKWQQIQQIVPLSCGFPFNSNAGGAHIYGVEMEVSAVVAAGLIASANASWLHAEYTAIGSPATTLDGRVQNVPEITVSASLAYRYPLANGLTLAARVENNYVGSRIDTTAQANYVPPYDLTNVRAGIEGDQWAASLFANNVTDRFALLSNTTSITVNSTSFNRSAYQQPLTYGIDVTYRFGGRSR